MRERETATKIEQKIKEAAMTVEMGFEKLVQEIKAGNTERYLEYLSFVSRFHKYSSFNQMLIFCQKPNATLLAGSRTWQDTGYQVTPGEQGISILAPVFVKHQEEDEYGRPVSIEKLAGFKMVKVFDASQMTEPVNDFWDFRKRVPENPEEKYQLVKRAVAADSLKIVEKPMPLEVRGRATLGTIYLRQGMDSDDRTNALIHGWGHELLHFGPGARGERNRLPSSIRESQVESLVYIVSKSLDMDSQFSKDHMLGDGNIAEALIGNMETIQKTSHYMIRGIERILVA